jgi:hypothetical protein
VAGGMAGHGTSPHALADAAAHEETSASRRRSRQEEEEAAAQTGDEVLAPLMEWVAGPWYRVCLASSSHGGRGPAKVLITKQSGGAVPFVEAPRSKCG